MSRIELTTYRLQGDCSTTELKGQILGAGGQNRTGLLQLGRLVGYHSLTRIKRSSLRAVTPIHRAGAKDHFTLV